MDYFAELRKKYAYIERMAYRPEVLDFFNFDDFDSTADPVDTYLIRKDGNDLSRFFSKRENEKK